MIEIKYLDEKGRGMAGDLFVKFAYPGDVIEVVPENHRKKTGRLTKLVKPSPDRQEVPCPHFGNCSGCSWHGLKYDTQLKHKESAVRKLFGECSSIIPSPKQYFYRNRMDYAFGPNYSVGLRSGKFDVVNVDKCWLTSEKSNAILNRLRYFVSWKKLEAHKEGIMRHAMIREGINIDNAVINILTSDKGEFPLEELWEKVQDLVQGVTWSINLSPADRSYGDVQKSLGQDYYMESLNGIKFKVPVQSFFQTNTKQAEKLLEIVKDFAELGGGESILDLYSGTGSIGLYLADRSKEVVGVEENEAAAELSTQNAELNNIKNFSTVAGKAENIIKDFERKFETIVLDPPRPGVHKKVLKKIGEIKPKKIIYVSCNPFTQKYDVEILKELGYQIKKCQPLDMFPHTPHIENIILLTR